MNTDDQNTYLIKQTVVGECCNNWKKIPFLLNVFDGVHVRFRFSSIFLTSNDTLSTCICAVSYVSYLLEIFLGASKEVFAGDQDYFLALQQKEGNLLTTDILYNSVTTDE